MKIFISWSGTVSREVAEALRLWLRDILTATDPWMSSEDIRVGVRWFEKISRELEATDFGIICVTPDSIKEPWVQFEAGALGKRVDQTRVVPLLIGLRKGDLAGPLSQFQAVEATKEGILQLVEDINVAIPDPTLRVKDVEKAFEVWWPALERRIASALRLESLDLKIIDKPAASAFLHHGLRNDNIKKVTILTYTNEVEASSIDHYRVKPPKEILVFKRSIFADLYDQQTCNIRRIAMGAAVKRWDKKAISLVASSALETEFEPYADITVSQLFYTSPPSRRAYMLDDRQASVSFYEKVDPLKSGGSRYKGMTVQHNLVISDASRVGEYLLRELQDYLNTLLLTCHTWNDEKRLLEGSISLPGCGAPCLSPSTVLVNMDTVLYESPKHERLCKGAKRLLGALANSKLDVWITSRESSDSIRSKAAEDFSNSIPLERIISGDHFGTPVSAGLAHRNVVDIIGANHRDVVVIEGDLVGMEAAEKNGLFCIGVSIESHSPGRPTPYNTAPVPPVFRDCSHLAASWDDVLDILRM